MQRHQYISVFYALNKNNIAKHNNFLINITVKSCLFYTLSCILLTILVAICIWGVSKLLINTPKYGLTFQPTDSMTDNNLIWINSADPKYWSKKMDEFLQVYENTSLVPGRVQHIVECNYNHPPRKGQVCDVDVSRWFPCNRESRYSYDRSSPCLFLQLNLIDTFVPEYYTDPTELPEDMPDDLKYYITSLKQIRPESLNTVWVSCDGENPVDAENIGPVQYIPNRGFPGYFFPHEHAEGYLGPLVAIHFERPMRGILISIKCKVWAKNIEQDNLGSVLIELLVD